jgi:hypothetical protein
VGSSRTDPGDARARVHYGHASRRANQSDESDLMQAGKALKPIPTALCPGKLICRLGEACQGGVSIETEGEPVCVKCEATTCTRDSKLYVCLTFEAKGCKLEHRRKCFDKLISLIEGVLGDLEAESVLKQYERDFDSCPNQ